MFDQVIQHLDDNILQDLYQSAYIKGHGTEPALLRVKSDIDQALDDGDGVLLALLALSAAFDTIDHTILTNRLESQCGIQGTANRLISSYLTGHTQRVRIGEEHSEQTDINIGVPQGSVMGPLLFTTYVRPVGDIARKHGVKFHGYADDAQLYLRFSPRDPQSLLYAIRTPEKCVDEVKKWMLENKLKVNNSKTEFSVCKKTQPVI